MSFAMNINDIYCKVKNCRFPKSHVTVSHKCGKCNEYGHGVVECNDMTKKNNLLLYHDDEMPDTLNCTIHDCKKSNTHTNDAHHCELCGVRGHGGYICPKLAEIEGEPILSQKGLYVKEIKKVLYNNMQAGTLSFIRVYGPLGSFYNIRQIENSNKVESFFFANQDVQDKSRVQFLENFTKGYTEVIVENQEGWVKYL